MPVQSKIEAPPIACVAGCEMPEALPSEATAKDLLLTYQEWIRYAVCEREGRKACVRAWPK